MADNEFGEKLEELNPSQIAKLRESAQTNLFFLAKGILGYDQVELGAHGALCNFMVSEKSNRRMVLMPRGFLKSTICTISDSIRLSLCNPNIRILIQNEVLDNATGFLNELKNHWIQGQLLRLLFPELIPQRVMGPGADWAKDHASVTRTSISKESTYTASGSGGSPQSKHFEVIKNDDLIGEDAKNSDTVMKKAIKWVGAMKPLLDRLDGQLDYYGTRKTLSDVYAHIMTKEKDRLKVFVREPIENGESIFSKMPLEELQRIMVEEPDVWAYDYMNNPVGEGGLDWGAGLLRHFHFSQDREKVWLEDHISGMIICWDLRELDIVITADPNSGKASAPDKAAVIAHGVTPRSQVLFLETWSGRLSPDGFINQIWDMAGRWHPRVIGIEDAGQQNSLYYFEKKMNDEGWYYRIQPLKPANKEKEVRIRTAFDTPLKARRVYVLASQFILISQIQMHPQLAVHNWDEIDCAAYGPQLYQDGNSLKDLQDAEEAEAKVLEFRERGITGYGRSV